MRMTFKPSPLPSPIRWEREKLLQRGAEIGPDEGSPCCARGRALSGEEG
jgi:hypothetical protein